MSTTSETNADPIYLTDSKFETSPILHPDADRNKEIEKQIDSLRSAGRIHVKIGNMVEEDDEYKKDKFQFERYVKYVDPNQSELFMNSVLREIGFEGDINSTPAEEIIPFLLGDKAKNYRKYQDSIATLSSAGMYILGRGASNLFESIATEDPVRSQLLFEQAKDEWARSHSESQITELEANYRYARNYIAIHKPTDKTLEQV